jgi:hypothetical protein
MSIDCEPAEREAAEREPAIREREPRQPDAPPIWAALVLLAWATLVYASYVLAYAR